MTPMQSPALKRGAVLYAGDYIYSCVAPQKNNKKQDSKECQPTFLHLKDDGTLVLAHGSTPSKPYREIWASKTPKPCKNKVGVVWCGVVGWVGWGGVGAD